MSWLTEQFRELWLVDFEFRAADGSLPEPVCMVAQEFHSGRRIELWEDELRRLKEPPFDIGADASFVAYYASAEMGCFSALAWKMPANVIDLFCEFRCLTNGLELPSGAGLLGALAWYGIDSMSAQEKESKRQLVLRGGPYTSEERRIILDYCASDVEALSKLLPAMEANIPRQALLRGRYMKAAAKMEWNGVPIDVPLFHRLREDWGRIQDEIIREIDRDYGVYDGRTFKRDRFAAWLTRHNIPWPRLDSGQLQLNDDTFKEMARLHPSVAQLRELRTSLSQMRLVDLAVGPDHRNRCLLSAFRAKTGRNQPSNAEFIFGPSAWLRSLIRPCEGNAIAYVDWEQQEFGIAAALSGDVAMRAAYRNGDPYLEFAKMAGAVPADATKKSHPVEREKFKVTALAVQYCMREDGLARRLGITRHEASDLLRQHMTVFRKFWSWSDAAVDYAILHGRIHTAFGWHCRVSAATNSRSLRNFPMQANGAEMLRLACCLATERGIRVAAPVHDALLIEGPASRIDEVVEATREAMREASEAVLSGFSLRSEAKVFRHPDRYQDERGRQMWDTVMKVLNETRPHSVDVPATITEPPILKLAMEERELAAAD